MPPTAPHPVDPARVPRRPVTALGLAWRLGAFVALLVAATWLTHLVREALDLMESPGGEIFRDRMVLVATVAFIVLLAVPFVPGVEIGITMLAVFGAGIAPLVYAATVAALMLAYAIGRLVPPAAVVRALEFIGLRRAAARFAALAAQPPEARLAPLLDGTAPRLMQLVTRFRYLGLMIALNLPGNALIGGGGGISMIAGMSGLFRPLPFLISVLVAVAPVPLAIMLLGA